MDGHGALHRSDGSLLLRLHAAGERHGGFHVRSRVSSGCLHRRRVRRDPGRIRLGRDHVRAIRHIDRTAVLSIVPARELQPREFTGKSRSYPPGISIRCGSLRTTSLRVWLLGRPRLLFDIGQLPLPDVRGLAGRVQRVCSAPESRFTSTRRPAATRRSGAWAALPSECRSQAPSSRSAIRTTATPR